MTVLIDPPAFPAHGRLWSHLVSDHDLGELHAFAQGLGIPERAFEGDHYDLPEHLYAVAVAAGAQPVSSRVLLARLQASGLRMPKRRGDKGVARARAVAFSDGTTADVDLFTATRPAQESRVFCSVVFVLDAAGHHLLTHSPRRAQWGPPGGWREPGESPAETAVREVREESGLVLTASGLVAVGYERFHGIRPAADGSLGLWQAGRDLMQIYRYDLPQVRPAVSPELDDADAVAWVSAAQLRERCADELWWPLAQRLFETRPGL